MRIGIDFRPVVAAPWSGIARQALAMEQALQALPGNEVRRFAACPADHPLRASACCPDWESPAHGLHRPRERWRFEAGFLPDAIAREGLQLYVATANLGLPLRGGNGCRYVQLLHDVFQLTERNFHDNPFKRLAYRIIDGVSIARSLRQADAVWTPSRFTAQQASRLFPWAGGKIQVLPNAVPAPPQASGADRPGMAPERYWLAVGTREPRKNIPWLIRTWHEARQDDVAVPPLVLVGWAGDVPVPLRRLPGLVWLSDVPEAELRALYAGADCLWQASYAEGFGLPVVEALAQGTPVAVAFGTALDEVAPPQARRFRLGDDDSARRLMIQLAWEGKDGAPEQWRAWAARFAMPAYNARVAELLESLFREAR
ncbi:glycosyl transferase family 1 [Chromobacterium violaceum]|uniref:glycosyltransferase family 4 protein n=1 Tax=Chromobacterium violaceum TaxID=536 RepID=UPI0009DB2915|nr:glycosyltransferase family 1 protein [Chromobacterium violaceum]OQS09025.1 glycosyl transferase family 1 [Chromobacterium violaceum]OQS23920.1 glycosyl transferase family 1 [Chromobacterium violaceum]